MTNVPILPTPVKPEEDAAAFKVATETRTPVHQHPSQYYDNSEDHVIRSAPSSGHQQAMAPNHKYSQVDENSARNGQISTSSPAGIAAATAVTPDKLANLLLKEGPLAIRHLTSHLSALIPGFAQLSSSKQRRLIIAVLDSGDPVTGCVFEKVGWGQWCAKKVGTEKVLAMRREAVASGANSENKEAAGTNTKTESEGGVAIEKKPSEMYGWSKRRRSITSPVNDVHSEIKPRSPRPSFNGPPTKILETITPYTEDAIASSSEDELSDEEEDDNGLYNKFQYHEIKPNLSSSFQRSHSSASRPHRASFNSTKGISKPKARSRLNSFDVADGMPDELSKLRSSSYKESYVRKSHSPSRRISISSLTNEQSSPFLHPSTSSSNKSDSNKSDSNKSDSNKSDTDEEDWPSVGADSLRGIGKGVGEKDLGFREEAAAAALVHLSGV